MEDEFILLFVERPKSDDNGQNAETERVEKVVEIEHFAEKHAISEHFDYRIKRICHKSHFYPFYLNVECIKRIDNRCHVEKKHAENFIKILYILKENFKRAEDKSDSDAENEQNNNRNGRKKYIGCYMGRLVAEKIEKNNKADENQKRDYKCYEVCNNI